jgi:stearoyl-CoA desaturase (delta-9 desaturase)
MNELELRRVTVNGGAAAAPTEQRLTVVGSVVTALILFGPLAGVVIAAVSLFGRGVTILDLGLGVFFYAVTGHGLSVGYHRMCAHRACKPTRGAKIALAVAGSMGFEGALVGWVAIHRRHHAFTDRPGDPHSPHLHGNSTADRIRGAFHAHIGWLFRQQPTEIARWAPDLAADPDLVRISSMFPLFCVVSLALPTAIGWAVTGTYAGALGGLVWGGLVRVFVLQHSTFAVNSACHIWGRRPFKTRVEDRATNFAPLAVLAMGDNWHNLHHSNPRFARHGVERHQIDSTARVIRLLELAGLVSDVRWPTPASLQARRVDAAAAEPADDTGGDRPVEEPYEESEAREEHLVAR